MGEHAMTSDAKDAGGRLLIGAPASGGGKTTFTCGLLQALVRRGFVAGACKCGPDYIDPMFHSEVIGAYSRNLDLFFSGEEQVRRLVADTAARCDVTVIEGVMGYYDGIAVSDEASAWDVARVTHTPAVLVIDGRGRARSIAAEVMGFARFRDDSQVAGVVLNRVSAMLYPRLKELIENETGVRVYGYVPVLEDASLESRHLGLVTAAEVDDLRQKLDRIAEALEKSVDIDGLLALASSVPDLGRTDWQMCEPLGVPTDASEDLKHDVRVEAMIDARAGAAAEVPDVQAAETVGAAFDAAVGTVSEMAAEASVETSCPLRIAVARDDAFCFYYADALRLLEYLGAELVEFSPLADATLPEGVSGLYLGGGYPELHARELSENESLRESLAAAIRAGLPTVAECGGFMYLHEMLEDDAGQPYRQVGVVPGTSFKTSRLGRFGYITCTAQRDGLLAASGGQLRAHEFHYWDSETPGDAFFAEKPQSTRSWNCGITSPTFYAGYPHLYLPGQPEAARRFVAACARFADSSNRG